MFSQFVFVFPENKFLPRQRIHAFDAICQIKPNRRGLRMNSEDGGSRGWLWLFVQSRTGPVPSCCVCLWIQCFNPAKLSLLDGEWPGVELNCGAHSFWNPSNCASILAVCFSREPSHLPAQKAYLGTEQNVLWGWRRHSWKNTPSVLHLWCHEDEKKLWNSGWVVKREEFPCPRLKLISEVSLHQRFTPEESYSHAESLFPECLISYSHNVLWIALWVCSINIAANERENVRIGVEFATRTVPLAVENSAYFQSLTCKLIEGRHNANHRKVGGTVKAQIWDTAGQERLARTSGKLKLTSCRNNQII